MFCLLTTNVGPKGLTMVNSCYKWLLSIFWKTAEGSNSQIRRIVVTKGIYIMTGNDVIGYFQSATNIVNATGTTANFSFRKYFLSIISENAAPSNFKIHHFSTLHQSREQCHHNHADA